MDNGQLSANQRWRQSGTTLSFKDFLEREKGKMASFTADDNVLGQVMVNKPLNEAVQDSLNQSRKDIGIKDHVNKNKIFGINKTILIISGVIIAGAIIYKLTKQKK